LTTTDQTVWASYTSRIEPLAGRTAPEPVVPPAPAPSGPVTPRAQPSDRPSARPLPAMQIGVHPPGLDKGTWQRFRAGKLAAARTLDLHGHTAQHAFHALAAFLRTAHADRLRCVEVVTGRGNGESGGVIRREFALWLNLPDIRPLLLGAAHPHAANPGAVRLLLRRSR
ncbi:MAG: Smr/MutS family protein, partial [Acetobacteraceae bacterium]